MAKIEPTSSAGAGDQTAVTLTCYAVGCCWAVDESDLTMTKKQMMDTPEGIVIKKTYSARSMVDPRNKKVLWHWPVMLPCIANRVQWWITGWKISVKYCEILLSRKKNSFFPLILYPICSMYGIFTIIYLQNWVISFGPMLVNICKYSIHWAYGYGFVFMSPTSHGSSWPGLATRNLRETSVDRRGKERTIRMRCWISVFLKAMFMGKMMINPWWFGDILPVLSIFWWGKWWENDDSPSSSGSKFRTRFGMVFEEFWSCWTWSISKSFRVFSGWNPRLVCSIAHGTEWKSQGESKVHYSPMWPMWSISRLVTGTTYLTLKWCIIIFLIEIAINWGREPESQAGQPQGFRRLVARWRLDQDPWL